MGGKTLFATNYVNNKSLISLSLSFPPLLPAPPTPYLPPPPFLKRRIKKKLLLMERRDFPLSLLDRSRQDWTELFSSFQISPLSCPEFSARGGWGNR